MLCSSPMSANTLSNTAMVLPEAALMCRPDWAINVNSPNVLRDTVFPPVFGPVIISVS